MKKRYVLLVILSFFCLIKYSYALVSICSYEEVRNSGDTTNDSQTLVSYISLYNGKRMIATSDASVQDLVDKSRVSWLGDIIFYINTDRPDWTVYYFTGAYKKTYLSPYMPYGEGERLLNKTTGWLNRKVDGYSNDEDATKNDYIKNDVDVKKNFVEEGVCPTYTCYCPSIATWLFYGGSKTEDDKNAAKSHCENVRTIYGVDMAESCIFQENKIDVVEEYFYKLKDKNSTFIKGALKILKGNIDGLTIDEMEGLIDKLSFRTFVANSATEFEYSVLARLVGNRKFDVHYDEINKDDVTVYGLVKDIIEHPIDKSIIKTATNCSGNECEDIYAKHDELVLVAKKFQKRYGTSYDPQQNQIVDDCKSIIGDVNDKDSFAYYLNIIFHFIQYGGPILVIILTIVEYFKAILDSNKDSLTSANKKTVTRIILVLLLFYVPVFINFVLETIGGITTNCNIG